MTPRIENEARIDVLAVMRDEASDYATQMGEAREAVAELIAAVEWVQTIEFLTPIGNAADSDVAIISIGTIRRMRAALARVRGAA